MSNLDPEDLFSQYGRRLIEASVTAKIPLITGRPTVAHGLPNRTTARGPGVQKTYLSIDSDRLKKRPDGTARPPIGIIGAGPAGLYAAMILEDLGIPFEIMEANDRTGGRLFTHYFSTESHDYYDVGAMRFPDTAVMRRVFELFRSPKLNTPDIQLEKHLIDYFFNNDNAFLMYNNNRARYKEAHSAAPAEDLFGYGVRRGGNVLEHRINEGAQTLVDRVIKPFVKGLEADPIKGWEELLQYDEVSTRAFMREKHGYELNTINWLESMGRSTGSYDRGLTDAVLGSVSFGGSDSSQVQWYCLDGGSKVLSDSMEKYIRKTAPGSLEFKKWVTGIEAVISIQPVGEKRRSLGVRVHVAGEDSRDYVHVIATPPLPCLQTIDLDKAALNFGHTNALRQLAYAASLKIGVKFEHAWWKTMKTKDGKPIDIVGGQSYTDRPLRTIVYPSYGLPGSESPTTVLIASYCSTDDASRLGGLIGAEPTSIDRPDLKAEADARLKELVLRDLAAVHNVEYEDLEKEYKCHFAFNWSANPFSQGAFANFGPGNFTWLYPEMTCPAAFGRLHFAGEALSTRHGWVAGAFESAWRAVHQILKLSFPEKLLQFYSNWGFDEAWRATPNKYGWAEPTNERDAPGGVEPDRDLAMLHLYTSIPEIFD